MPEFHGPRILLETDWREILPKVTRSYTSGASSSSVVSRNYLYTGKLSFSACLAENPDLADDREPGILRAKRA
jgi:hypothetical protein